MADQKLTDLEVLADPATDDLTYVVDVSAGLSGSKQLALGEIGGVNAVPLAIADSSDAAAANGTLFNGTDHGWLAYKDSTGTVSELAQYYAGPVHIADSSDALAPTASMYHSTDQDSLTYKDASGNVAPVSVPIAPSGDVTGVADRTAIQAAIDSRQDVHLGEGNFYIDQTLQVMIRDTNIHGCGFATRINVATNDFTAIKISDGAYRCSYCQVNDLMITGANVGLHLDSAPHFRMNRVRISECVSHGMLCTNSVWTVQVYECLFYLNGGDGVHALDDGTSIGNHFDYSGSTFWYNSGAGCRQSGAGVNFTGCAFEQNSDSGLVVDPGQGAVGGMSISGCYFEVNAPYQLLFHTRSDTLIHNVYVNGCYLYAPAEVECLIKADGVSQGMRGLHIGNANYLVADGGTTVAVIDIGDYVRRALIQNYSTSVNDTGIENTYINANGVRPHDGATIGIPSTANADALDQSLYDSTDLGRLSYKASSSVIVPVLPVTPTGGDDTAVLTEAFNGTSPGGLVRLLGDFTVSGNIVITRGLTIDGGGATTITQTVEGRKTLAFYDQIGAEVRGIHFIGVGTEVPWGVSTWNGVAGIYVQNGSDFNIHDCKFTNHAGGSVVVIGPVSRTTIRNNFIRGMGTPTIPDATFCLDACITCTTTRTEVDDVTITGNDCGDHALGIICASSGVRVDISCNHIHDIPGSYGISCTGTGEMMIANNIITNIQHRAITLRPSNGADQLLPVTIANNIIKQISNDAIYTGATSSATSYTRKHLVIEGNNISDLEGAGIRVDYATGALVSGNKVSGSVLNGFNSTFSSCFLSGNAFELAEVEAISVDDITGDFIINDTDIVDCPSVGSQHVILLGASSNGQYFLGANQTRFDTVDPTAILTNNIAVATGATCMATGTWANKTGKPNLLNGTIDPVPVPPV